MFYLVVAHYCAWFIVVWFLRCIATMITQRSIQGFVSSQALVMMIISIGLHFSLYKLGLVPLLIK